jgi:hypothetical protein
MLKGLQKNGINNECCKIISLGEPKVQIIQKAQLLGYSIFELWLWAVDWKLSQISNDKQTKVSIMWGFVSQIQQSTRVN